MNREELFSSSLEQLEYEKILEHISGYSASSLGVEHLAGLYPLGDEEAIRRELGMVTEARELVVAETPPPLDGIYDIRKGLSLSKVTGSYLGGEELRGALSTIQALRKVYEFFQGRHEQAPLLHELTADIHTNRLFERHIEDAIDEVGNVRDNASRELFRIRRDIVDKSAALRQRLQKILRQVAEEELVTDEYVTLREGRLVLPVRNEFKRKIPGIIHGESQTGSTVYLEPAQIFDMNNEIAELTFAERREVERILKTLTAELGSEADMFGASLWKLQLFDSVTARARYAERYNCTAPVITDDDTIIIRDAYHPLLLLRLNSVVPMSVELSREQRCVVISGPNAGGKTVAIKTLGLVTMMALSGIHPPANECKVHPCALFTDIGDRQSLENDLSTFSAHMTRIDQIMRNVQMGDIVLLDEIGTGTDPDEGGVIAAAVLEYLLERRAFTLTTTHHSSMKIFAYETEGVVNAGMEFDTATITPTYRLHVGAPGNSYAFELLQRSGFEQKIIGAAKAKLGDDRNRMSEIINELEQALSEGRELRTKHERELRKAEEIREKYEQEARDLKERKQGLIADAREQAKAALVTANSLIENTIREIRSGATNERVKELRKTIEDVRGAIDNAVKEESLADAEAFRKGDAVKMKDTMQTGELEFDPDEKGNVVAQFGSIRMRVNVSELEKVSRKEARKHERASSRAVVNAEPAKTRLDLRGRYAEEAVIEVEQAITAGLDSGYTRLEIVHGKGSGALRIAVQDYLRKHPSVAEFRLAPLTEGGAGVTIVDLK